MRPPLSCACLILFSCSQVLAASQPTTEIPLPSAASQQAVFSTDASASAFAHSLVLTSPCLDGPAIEGHSVVSMLLNYGYGQIPPDPNCAVGPAHVINATNGVIQWRPKANPQDTPEFEQPLALFFGLVGAPTEYAYTSDPKVIYDQYAGRFVLVLMGGFLDPMPWLVAVSKTSNPNDGWWRHTIPRNVVIGGVTYYGDYPGLAVDDEAIYLTANMFSGTLAYYGPYLWIIRKTPGAYTGPDGIIVQSSYDLKALGMGTTTTQPAHMFGPVPNGVLGTPFGTFLVSYSGLSSGGIESVRVVSVNDPLSSSGGPFFVNQTVSCGNIDNTAIAVPDAPQLGGPALIDALDRRVYNAVWRGNALYLGADCIPIAGSDAGQVTAHWWRVNTTFDGINSPTLALGDQGDIGAEDLGAGTYTFCPCVMVDAVGDLAVGFAASGPAIYAGAYFASRTPGDPPGTIGSTCVLAPGLDYYVRTVPPDARNRWGDYTGLALCPVDESTFWIYNEYAGIGGYPDVPPTLGQGIWHTKLGKFHITQTVSVAITSFDVIATNGAVTVRAAFRSDLGATAVNVYRGNEDAALLQIDTVRPNGPGVEYVDHGVQPGSSYRYRIGVVDADGEFYSPIVSVSLDPAHTALSQNHPNPFNPTTEIPFSVGETGRVSLDIYDAGGHLVRHLLDGVQDPGTHTATWNGRDDRGNPAGSGVYFYRLRAGKISDTKRMVLLK